jgi:uncharacterized damage-inducible protein DinB
MDPVRMYEYLEVSRARIFDAVRPLSDARYRSEHPIGLGSLARTLHHMRAAEALYMKRVTGHTTAPDALSPEDDPETSTLTALVFPDLERLWGETAAGTRSALPVAFAGGGWLEPMDVVTVWDGVEYRYEAAPADFFGQLVVHEVHHRAQAVHMLRRLEISVGEIDYSMLMFLPEMPEG